MAALPSMRAVVSSVLFFCMHLVASSPVLSICQLLEASSNSTFLPNSAEYPALRTENWSETAWRTPTCIFRPTSTAEVQRVVPLLVKANVKFAIRAGGHSPSPNAGNIDNGVLIDLAGFNDISYNADKDTATMGTGLRWRDVYGYLDQYQVTVVGGRVLDVGVGGLILGGGLSYLSDLHGLACDNVVSFNVVLANGTLVTASARSNPDLYWALKGGGNNFGIVTSVTLRTYPIHEVWGGIQVFPFNDLSKVLGAMAEYQAVPNKDPYANAFLQSFVTNETLGIALTLIYLKPVVRPTAFNSFYSLTPQLDTTKLSTFIEFLSGQGTSGLKRIDWRTTSFVPSARLYTSIDRILRTSPALSKIKSVTAGSVAMTLQPISENLVRKGHANGGNALGLKAVNQTWFVLDPTWYFGTDDKLIHASTRSMLSEITTASKQENRHLPYLFMNDAAWDQAVLSSYGEKNLKRLREVAKRYDPKQVFQTLVPGGWKLF